MPALKRVPSSCVIALAAILPTLQVLAQDAPPSITLRAIGPHLPNRTVEFIAENSAPIKLGDTAMKEAAESTPVDFISKLCGSFRETYFTALKRVNGIEKLPKDQPLGEKAQSLVWPACLYVETYPKGLKRTVQKDEKAWAIYAEMTGGGGTDPALGKFFGADPKGLQKVRAEQVLVAAHSTAPVSLVPVGMDTTAFLAGVKYSAGQGNLAKAAESVREVGNMSGSIILGSTVASANMHCNRASESPFDLQSVITAYQFASKRRFSVDPMPPGGRADVAVVDNGFFGANARTHPAAPFEGSPFPKRFFRSDPRTTVSESMVFGEVEARPINFENEIAPDPISGHGTHVTGIILGGPTFKKFRDEWPEMLDPWATVTVYNVARGREQLVKGSAKALQGSLGANLNNRVVNLSLTHDGIADIDVGKTYDRLFRSASNSLFIVAAGNNGRDVSRIKAFPAALGGFGMDNVITVAAHDGDGFLAPFSNWGKESVDIAAPGCEIASWISNTTELVSLSGTSQAAPVVTFAATLLRSLDGESSARSIKQRIVVSGDLLPREEDSKRTAYLVKLNIAKALYWFDDYLQAKGEWAGEYLGRVKAIEGLRCVGETAEGEDPLQNLLALKRRDSVAYLFNGRTAGRLSPPCQVAGDVKGRLVFSATRQVMPNGVDVLSPTRDFLVELDDIKDLILRAESRQN